MEDQQIPTLAVVVFENEEILYEAYLGKPDLYGDAELRATDMFLLASLSKVVTATALLRLYDEGKFSLDDNVNYHLPFVIRVPGQTTGITFRMLLTHTSGIADGDALDDQYFYGKDPTVSLGSFLQNYLVPGGTFYNAQQNFYDFEPGTRHEYSNEGNALIGLLVETISGTDFNSYCKENIFEPLGMNNTYWRLDEIDQTIVRPYESSGGGFQPIEHYTFTDYPNGGLRSTARDMATFLSVLAQAGQADGYQLLKPATAQAMLTPQIPAIDGEVGLHLFLMDASNGLWGHDGGERGVATIMGFNPDTKVGAVILTNQEDAELEEILAEAYALGVGL